jgi:hypothetical protein
MPHQLSKLIMIAWVIGYSITGNAQNTARFTAALEPAANTSFYKINLSPALIAHCRNDLYDIRIWDNESGQQVPYLLKSDASRFFENNFVNFPILSVAKKADKQTHILIKGNHTTPIGNLLLFIKNTDAVRSVTLSGSDNNRNWYVIKENIYLDEYFSNHSDEFIQTLSFPPSKYAFYQLTIIGERILPVNITRAGLYTQQVTEGKYAPVPVKEITQQDSSDKKTYISLRLDAPYLIHKISIQCAGPKYFNRLLEINTTPEKQSIHENRFRISSNGNSSFPLKSTKTNKIVLVVHNEDNPPLKITGITCSQLNQSLFTYLEVNKKYSLRFGDSAAGAPAYDLNFFKDSIPAKPPLLAYGPIEVRNPAPLEKKETVITKQWMWAIILAAGIGLLLFTIQLARQINKRGV